MVREKHLILQLFLSYLMAREEVRDAYASDLAKRGTGGIRVRLAGFN